MYQICLPLITLFDFSQQLFSLGSLKWNCLCFQGTSDNESKDPEDEAGRDEEGGSKKDLPQGEEVESQEKDEEKNHNKKGTAEEEEQQQQQEEEEEKRKK